MSLSLSSSFTFCSYSNYPTQLLLSYSNDDRGINQTWGKWWKWGVYNSKTKLKPKDWQSVFVIFHFGLLGNERWSRDIFVTLPCRECWGGLRWDHLSHRRVVWQCHTRHTIWKQWQIGVCLIFTSAYYCKRPDGEAEPPHFFLDVDMLIYLQGVWRYITLRSPITLSCRSTTSYMTHHIKYWHIGVLLASGRMVKRDQRLRTFLLWCWYTCRECGDGLSCGHLSRCWVGG
jgi:hypothetical protein